MKIQSNGPGTGDGIFAGRNLLGSRLAVRGKIFSQENKPPVTKTPRQLVRCFLCFHPELPGVPELSSTDEAA